MAGASWPRKAGVGLREFRGLLMSDVEDQHEWRARSLHTEELEDNFRIICGASDVDGLLLAEALIGVSLKAELDESSRLNCGWFEDDLELLLIQVGFLE